ncbi:DUF2977 domain-containing protein [Latilactobacillus curvatus]|uniref:DUF2977 domain-containing protein n=1 Tax=Latilactobacillus curvatus TaxID=28038 RepID=UPI003C2EBB7B
MLIKINKNNEIEEYATIGGLPNSIEIDDSLKPVDFNHLFKKGYYLYQDDEIVVNQNYEEPTVDIPTPEQPSGPSPEMLAINELGIQLAKHLAGGN